MNYKSEEWLAKIRKSAEAVHRNRRLERIEEYNKILNVALFVELLWSTINALINSVITAVTLSFSTIKDMVG